MNIQSVLSAIVISVILISGRVAAQTSPPSAPASFGVDRGNGLVVFKWRPGSDNGSAIEKYQYQQSEDGGSTWSNWTDIVGSDERHANRSGVPIRYIRTGLTNGRRYDFQIRAVSSAGDGAASASVSATPVAVPHIPGNFALEAGNGRVTLSWDDPNDATITRYRYNTRHPDQGWLGPTEISNSDVTINGTTMSYPVTSLTNNLEYAFTLYAVNNVGNGPATQRFYATPVLSVTAPAAVTNLAAEAGDQHVTLSWDNPNNASITTYQYRQSEDSGSNWSPDWTNITGSDANTTSHRIENLTNDTEYTFEIRAVNATNGTSTRVSATPALLPLTVTWPEDIKGTEDSSIWTSSTSTQITVSGGRPSYTYEIDTNGAPAGLSIDPSGTLIGTPTVNGTFTTVTVVVRDEAGQSVSNPLTITISPPLSVSPIAYKTVEKDSMITPIHLSASGGWEPYTYSISGAPSGISLSNDNRITGSPSQDGTSTITVTVTDDHGNTAERSFNMSVYSLQLAKKFSPILILTEHPSREDRKVIFPEPVEIMGATSVDSLWFHFTDEESHRLPDLDLSYQNLSTSDRNDLIAFYQRQYPDINFSQNKFASIPEVLTFDAEQSMRGTSVGGVRAHFEYPGVREDDDEGTSKNWYHYYFSTTHPKRGAAREFPHTAYVHIFDKGDGNVVIQYYYFYPFNDFQNNHEGDWQHINVIVNSHNPDNAALVGIDYNFHRNGLTYNSIGGRVFDPQIRFAPAEGGTHPVVYVGAGSHGGYPTGGTYPDPGGTLLGEGVDEGMTKSGIVLSTNVEDTNREVAQSYDLIFLPNPDPGQPNKGLSPAMSWLGSEARWGTLDVPSSGSAERYDESPVGPFHKDSWGTSGASGYSFFKVPYGEFIGDPPELRRISHNSKRWFQQFPIVQDVTWSGTIKLIGDIVVYPGATLTIDAGTTIRAYPNRDIHSMKDSNRVDIINYGRINANGTSSQPIVFRSDSSSPASGHWYGIRNHGNLTMSHFTIQHSVVGLDLQGTQTLTDMTLSNNNRNNTTSLTITTIADVTATQNGAITDISVSASGGWGPYTYSTSELPAGIVLDQENALITGTPTATGESDITVTVRDAVNDVASTTFNLSVSAAPTVMSIATIADVIATQNVAITPIKVKASGGSGSYTYWIGSNRPPASSPLPESNPPTGSGLSIDSSSGRITGTPTASGDFTITVAVRDGAGSRDLPTQVSRSFTMRVRPRVTVSAIGNITVTQNTAITLIQVSASGGQTPYAYSTSSNPATGSGLSINSSSGQITGTPTQTGTFTLTVTVTDNHGRTGTRSFSMTVNAPTPISPALTTAEISDITVKISGVQTNSPITPIQVSASGGQTPYAYSLSSNPATGSGLSINSSSGEITGTPTQRGSFTLTVTVTDHASATTTESFSMAVSLIGDFNDDGMVDVADHLLFVAVFGLSEDDDGFNADMDLNGDGTIGTPDFLIFVSHFGSSA